jgi:putative salt-induced outer membrane protein YdiY
MKRLLSGLVAGAAALMGVCASMAAADTVVLKDGDRLTGTITSLSGGKLTLHTGAEGDVTIDPAQINTFSTDEPVLIQLSDGSREEAVVHPMDNGMFRVGQGMGASVLAFSDIKSINVPPAVWTGDVKFGGLLVRGNTDTDTVNFGFDVKRTTDQDTFDFNGSYLFGRTHDRIGNTTATTADSWTLEAKYQYNFTPRFYGFLDVPLLHDRLAQLYLRITPALGVGYKFYDTADFKLSGEAGVAGIIEQYSNGTPDSETFSLLLAYHLTKKFNDKVSVFSDLSYYPGVSNVSEFVVDFDAGLHMVLTKHFFSELRLDLDYDNTPALGALHTDSKVALDVGYNF